MPIAFRRLRHVFVAVALACVPLLYAQDIVSAQPSTAVGLTRNGIAQVDIAAPSAAGVSHNVYQQFNVPANGVIFNNSARIVSTQLAGQITGNPALQHSAPARTILNEVRSALPSQLVGYA